MRKHYKLFLGIGVGLVEIMTLKNAWSSETGITQAVLIIAAILGFLVAIVLMREGLER